MYLVYVDDSGDPGRLAQRSPTEAFVLCALAIRDTDWLETLDQVKQFRQFVRREFGLRIREELKASHLVHGTGAFGDLHINDAARLGLYRLALRLQRKLGTLKTWAILVDKKEYEKQNWSVDIRDFAWRTLLERIEAFSRYGKETCMLFPDEGHPRFVQQLIRKMRRFNYVSSHYSPGMVLSRPIPWLVEDPNFRRSDDSYFVQLADLNAYAAYRHVYPKPYFGSEFWEQLEDVRNERVNALTRRGPTGIVVRPGPK